MFHLFRQSNRQTSFRAMEHKEIFSYLPQCDSHCFASAGRSLLALLIKRLGLTNQDTCLMPSYVAEGVISPFINSGVRVRFYKVDEKLFAKLEALEEQIKNDPSIRLIILIHPFGFEQPVKPIKQLLFGKKIYILEDCAQALFCRDSMNSLLGQQGDFSLFSLNKFLPVPDGAILQSYRSAVKLNEAKFKPENEERETSIRNYIQHLQLNFEMMQSREPHVARKILGKTVGLYEQYYAFFNKDLSLYAPCSESKKRLKYINFDEVIAQRIANTRSLYNNLKNSTFQFVYEKWGANCVPMAVPIYVAPENRSEILSKLFDRNILLSTLIDKWDFIPEHVAGDYFAEKWFVESHLLIPVNEFLSSNQMGEMIEIMNGI